MPVPQNEFWAHVLPPYQLSSNNFNSAAIGVKIRSKGRSHNFTKCEIAKCDLECSLIYDPALLLGGELSKKSYTC